MQSKIVEWIRKNIRNNRRLFWVCLILGALFAIAGSLEATYGLCGSVLAPRNSSAARADLSSGDSTAALQKIIELADAEPDLTLFDSARGIIAGGDKDASAIFAYSVNYAGKIRLICESAGKIHAAEILASIIQKTQTARPDLGLVETKERRFAAEGSVPIKPIYFLFILPGMLILFMIISECLAGSRRGESRQ